MRQALLAALATAALAVPAPAQQNPFKLPKANLQGEVKYDLGGDTKGTAYTAFDATRQVNRSTSTVRMMGKETTTSTWTLVTADSMFTADLERKTGTAAPNLLPYLAKAYDGLDKGGKQRFHENLKDMSAMFSRALGVSSFGASGERRAEKTIAGEACEEREFMGFSICAMKRAPTISLRTAGSLVCYRFEETATSVNLGAPPESAFERPAGVRFESDRLMENPDSAARGFVGYLASQALSDSLAAARQELEAARAEAGGGERTELTEAERAQMEAACETLRNFDMNKAMAAAGKAMVESMKQAAVD
jgi:hypothetical protein